MVSGQGGYLFKAQFLVTQRKFRPFQASYPTRKKHVISASQWFSQQPRRLRRTNDRQCHTSAAQALWKAAKEIKQILQLPIIDIALLLMWHLSTFQMSSSMIERLCLKVGFISIIPIIASTKIHSSGCLQNHTLSVVRHRSPACHGQLGREAGPLAALEFTSWVAPPAAVSTRRKA